MFCEGCCINIAFVFIPAIREDRYFIAGRAVAVSLVHGGPAPSCFSKTLFDCIAQGPDVCTPVLEDVGDCELYNKIKKVGSKWQI